MGTKASSSDVRLWDTQGHRRWLNGGSGQGRTGSRLRLLDRLALSRNGPVLKKDMSQLLQLGVVGYDQFQVTANGGTVLVGGIPAPAKLIPSYSVHGVGGQINYILPAENLLFFFKGYDEYRALARVQGRTIVFGGSWTWGFPKAKTPRIPRPILVSPADSPKVANQDGV
jgi:hypothetical protein